ncbi:MAG TPA: DUF3352 domain-containing protein [Spirillospora sp.]|nr:DUF3352 domain-containing protein [Spirillospora sp.]
MMWSKVFRVILIVTIGLGSISSGAAQDEDLLSWIPADFAGFIELHVRSDSDTLTALTVATFAASFLQPQRIEFQPVQSLGMLIPLTALDVEDASFERDISPWLNQRVILVYPSFDADLQSDDRVLLLPTRDPLQSASSLSRILDAQDVLERDSYRGYSVYLADKTTVVITPLAVLIGSTDSIKAMLDTQAGERERLIDQPAYQAAAVNRPQNAIVSGYLAGHEFRRVLSVLIKGDESAVPVLEALGRVLNTYQHDPGLEQLVLNNALDGVGFYMQADTLRLNSVDVTLTLYDAEYTGPTAVAEFNPDILNLLPQNAMVVQSGTNAPDAVYTLLAALPLTNFASEIVGAFPIQPSAGAASGLLTMPTASDIERALGGLLTVLNRQANFDLDHDLLQYLDGSYAAALLPRPNDPLPPLNMPFDLLLVADVDNPEAAINGAARLIEILLALETLETRTINDLEFRIVEFEGEPVVYTGAVDDRLVVATGAALRQALDARRGDDRLVSRDRWQALSRPDMPQLYIDIPVVYATFLPQFAGAQLRQIRQMGVRARQIDTGLFQLHLTVTLPSQLN